MSACLFFANCFAISAWLLAGKQAKLTESTNLAHIRSGEVILRNLVIYLRATMKASGM